MYQPFQNAGAVALVGAIALLMLAVACSAPTPTPLPTATPTSASAQEPSTGNWRNVEYTDPISDNRLISIGLYASESTGVLDKNPMLLVGCLIQSPGEISSRANINWDAYLGSDDPIVAWRVDDEEASTSTWDLLGDDVTSSPEIEQIVSDLLRANKITIRVYRDFAESLTAVWYVEGFAEAYKQVEEGCKK